MKNNILKPVLFMFVISLIISGCSKTKDEILPTEPVPIDLTPSQVNLIESGNSFSFDIFRRIASNEDQSKNIIISPLSISYALSMTLNGANGSTRDAMLNALRVSGITPEEINTSYKSLTEALLSVDKRVLISIANSVWTENKFQVKKPFIDILTGYYDAESKQFDIDDPSAPDKMNEWIENNTNGLIKNMIDELDPATVMMIINAIYYKGKWKSQFDPDETISDNFYKPGGTSITVPMMKQKTKFRVYEGTDFTLAEFPYGQGNFVMDIILPDAQNGLPGLLPSLTDIAFSGWIDQLQEKEVELSMPKFKYDYKKKLKEVLTDMGMGIAFLDGADFTNISSTLPLAIDDVTHQAFIETNEEGTEAAAATVVGIIVTSMPQIFDFNIDHPFFYIIRETTTNSIIFMGRVADPLAD
jgi:serpin B